jgi:outer membrane immunogenic protein
MRKLHTGALTAVAMVMGLTAQTASAQGLRGVRAEGQVGLSSWHSEGNSHSTIGWGGEVGADFDLGGFVVGPVGHFWWAPQENETHDGAGLADHKTFQEWGLGARAGFLVTPATLVYGKVAYVRNEQRKRFTPDVGVCGGNACQAPGYYNHGNVSGIQWGAGVEQMIMNNFYVKAEGRYSDYRNHTHTVTGLIGLGAMFGAAAPAPEIVPVAPPPPVVEAPATQTCPDGSVILATSTCPAPPPPPAPVERGERG